MAWTSSARFTKAAGAAAIAGPYVRRLARDEELRENVRDVVRSAGRLYERLGEDDRLRRIVNDESVREDVDEMLKAMQHAGQRVVRKPEPKRRWVSFLPLFFLAMAVMAVFAHRGTRRKIMGRIDRMMGRQEIQEFEWQETTDEVAA